MSARRRIAAVTGSRAEYGLLRWVLKDLRDAGDVDVELIATAAHLSPAHGHTVEAVRADGIEPIELEIPLDDTEPGVARAISHEIGALASLFSNRRPDLLVLVADRYETFAAAVAASAMRIAIAHLHGGEVTAGAQDDAWRHAITKLAHVHLASTATAARRLAQLGEEPWRIHTVGASGLDHVRRGRPLERDALASMLGMDLRGPLGVVTFHPATLEGDPGADARALATALEGWPGTLVITAPNADLGGTAVRRVLEALPSGMPGVRYVESLGNDAYLGLLRIADVMVGNSSSGLIEAPAFRLPVVNVGGRQEGRERAANVIDVAVDPSSIRAGIDRALSPAFRASLDGLVNPYGDGHASERIVKVLREVELGPRLLRKRFVDLPYTLSR